MVVDPAVKSKNRRPRHTPAAALSSPPFLLSVSSAPFSTRNQTLAHSRSTKSRRRLRDPKRAAATAAAGGDHERTRRLRICDSPASERTPLNGRGAWLLDRTAQKKGEAEPRRI